MSSYKHTQQLQDHIIMDTWTAAAVAIVAAITTYLLWFTFMSRGLRGPRVWPVVGSLPGLMENSERLHEWITDNLRACGGTYQTCIWALPFLARKQGLVTVTCDPANLQHLLRTRFHNYPKGPAWQSVFKDLLGDGIFNSDGHDWLSQRKTAALEFTTRTLRRAMSRWVGRAVTLRFGPALAEAQAQGRPVDLQDLLLRLTFDNICGLALGQDPETCQPGPAKPNAFASAFDAATEASLRRFLLPGPVWRLKKLLRIGLEASLPRSLSLLHSHLHSILHNLRSSSSSSPSKSQDSLLSRFVKNHEEDDDLSLRHVALNFILAGRDTSAAALTWFFYLLTQNPGVEAKILRELVSVLSDSRSDLDLDDPITFEEADRMVYLKAALSETLRLYPSVPEDSKHALRDDVLPDGTFVPAGSSVTYSIYAAGRMRSAWGEDCLEFRPERWISEDGDRFVAAEGFRFVAFNGGPRVCLGKELAYLQMKSVAAAVLLRHRLEVVEGHRVDQKMSLTLFMKFGLLVRVFPRDLNGFLRKTKIDGDGDGDGTVY